MQRITSRQNAIVGRYRAIPAVNTLHAADGANLFAFASVITDYGHHLGLLQGNDVLTGGAGDDTLVGDDMVVINPSVTFDAASIRGSRLLESIFAGMITDIPMVIAVMATAATPRATPQQSTRVSFHE